MNRTRIMLVMTSTNFRDDLIMQLVNEGFEIILASGGYDALNKLRKYSVDQIVTQINLSQYDGLELILNIRDLRMDVPIIAISFNDTNMEKEVLQAGASAFIRYPIDISNVIDLIKYNARLPHEERNL